MWSGRNSFLPASLSNSESLSTPSSCSESQAQTVMTVSINKTNNSVKPVKEFHPNISAKSYSEFKSFDVKNVLQTIRRFDQKYSHKRNKQFKEIPVQNDTCSAVDKDNMCSSSYINSRRGTDTSLEVKPGMNKSSLLHSAYSTSKSRQKISRLLSPVDLISQNSRKGISRTESFDLPENSEFDSNKLELLLRNPLTNVQNSNHSEVHLKSNNDFNQEVAQPKQTVSAGSENISFELNDRASEVLVLPKKAVSKLELQSEETLNKSQFSIKSLSEGHHGLISRKYIQKDRNTIRTHQTSRLSVSEETGYLASLKESQLEICDEINNGLSDNTVQEDFSFKLTESDDRIGSSCSNSSGNIFTSSEAVHNFNLGHLHNTSVLSQIHTDQELLSTNISTSQKSMSVYPTPGNSKTAPQLESDKDNSVVSELSDSNISPMGSHGLFTSLPYKILTIEDLVAAHELKEPEEEEKSDVQRGVKCSKANKTVSANNTRGIIHSEIEQKTILDSQEQINDETEEEIEEEIEEENISDTSINDLSVKTNSSYEEITDQLSSHSEMKYAIQQSISKEGNVLIEQTNISPRSLSSQVVSNKSQQEDVLLSSVEIEYMHKTISASHGSGELSLAKSSSQLDPEQFRSFGTNSNENEVKSLEDTKYCSIGIQTDINEAYHSVLYAKNEIQQSSYNQPVMHSDGGESHSHQEIIPMYRYYSRTEGQEKASTLDLALSLILRHQIELTKHFVSSQQRMYEAYCTSVENMSANYKPVTLEDTKQYIRSTFRRRDRLNGGPN